MTKRFLDFIPFIFKWEGGYGNDPDDPGGETNFGIDKRSHPGVDIRRLTRNGAVEIYWRDYWSRNKCEEMASPIADVFFNCCVNCGPARARKLLACSADATAFLDNQDAWYRKLAQARPALHKFLHGWLNRTSDLRQTMCADRQA